MRPLNIEFQPLIFLANRFTRWLVATCLVVAGAQTVAIVWLHLDMQAVRKEIAEQHNKIRDLRRVQESSDVPLAYREGAVQALRISSFPLQSAMASLEDISTPGLQVTLLEVNLDEGVAKAEVESVSAKDLEKYLAQLAEQDQSSKWKVLSIQESVDVPLPSGAPGPLPPGLLPGSTNLSALPTKTSGGVHLVLEWRRIGM